MPLKKVIEEADRIFKIVEDIVDARTNGQREDCLVGIIKGMEGVVIELVIEPEDTAVNGLDRIWDRGGIFVVIDLIIRSGLAGITLACISRRLADRDGCGSGLVE